MDTKIHALKVTEIIKNSRKRNENYNTIVFSGNNVLDVGKYKDLKRNYSFDTFDEIEKAIIIPGLINTHTHSIQTFFRGLADNLQLLDWLNSVILPGEASLSNEEVYASSLLGFVDMISNGTTFSNDMMTTHHVASSIQAAIDTGIRVKTGKLLMDKGPDNLVDDTDSAIEETHALIEQFHNKNPLLEYSLNPRFLLSCTPKLMQECAKIMQNNTSLSFHTHACENKAEIEAVQKIHGKYITALYEYGNLGNRSILAHGVWLDSSDINLLRNTNTAIAHCPSSNAKLASGVCDWPKLIENDIPVGLGTDGPPSNNTMDMFREMRVATFLQRVATLDETKAPSNSIFDLATTGGAKALRRTDLGTLEKGKKADFLVVDISHPSNHPIHDYISHLVFKASGKDVLKTFIAGRLVYDSKQQSLAKMYPVIPTEKISKALKISTRYVKNKMQQDS